MRRNVALAVGALACAGTLCPKVAAADDERRAWWLEARPWTCVEWIAPLARHVALACDAHGSSCTVAAEEQRANRLAILHCDGDHGSWILEAWNRSSQRLWSLNLSGDTDERLRKAGVWIASDGPGDSEKPKPPAERPLHQGDPGVPNEPQPYEAPKTELPVAHRDRGAQGAPTEAAPTPRRGGLVLTGHWGGDAQDFGREGGLWGARLDALVLRGGVLHLAAGAQFDRVSGGQSAPGWLGRVGPVVGVGAPWTDDRIGLSLEGALGLNGGALNVAQPAAAGYAGVTLTLQPVTTPLFQPLATVSYGHVWAQDSYSTELFSIGLGFAWHGW
jgi:hypothetical protein